MLRTGPQGEKSIGDEEQTLAQLCEWYLATEVVARREENERSRVKVHILDSPLGRKKLPAVQTDDIKALLSRMQAEGYAAWTREGLRRKLRTIYNRAAACGRWRGHNPMVGVKPIRVPKKIHNTPRADEVSIFLAAASERWRGDLAMSLYLALRMQEVFGLLKSQVDLQRLLLRVERSMASTDETKAAREALLPIPRALVPYIQQALDTRPGKYLFPNPETGRPRTKESAKRIVEWTMKRAGLVQGYDHKCRRCAAKMGQAYVERHTDAELRRCPVCGFKLWPCPVARPLSWHDLRDTTATLLKKQRVPIEQIAKILRHSDIRLLERDIYGETDAEDLREAVNSIWPSNGSLPFSDEKSNGRGPLAVQEANSSAVDGSGAANLLETSSTSEVGARGFEPPTPCSQSRCATRLRYAPRNRQVLTISPRGASRLLAFARQCSAALRGLVGAGMPSSCIKNA